ncbi:MAG TPA: Ig-like domain-containing protein [Devosiaceae bacterium]
MLLKSGLGAGLSRRVRDGLLSCFALLMLVGFAALWSTPASAGGCGPFNITVSNSGTSAPIDASTCGEEDGFRWGIISDDEPGHPSPSPAPLHGTVTIDWAQSQVTYRHNGDSATSDDFSFIDAVLDPIPVHVTILPATSNIVISPTNLPAPAVGSFYSQSLSATGETAPYTWVLLSGTLPPGLSLSLGGTISGTPTQYGPFNFTVRATDSTGKTSDKGYGFTIPTPVHVLSPSSPPHGAVGVHYSQQFGVTGGTAPYTYAVEVNVDDGLPPGLSMSPDGLLSGTPTMAGTFRFSLLTDDDTTISNSGGNFKGVHVIDMVIDALPPAPVSSSFTAAAVAYNTGSAAAASVNVAGHAANNPISYAVGSATTANGGSVSIDASGVANYTPPAGFRGNDSFTFTASNTGGTSASATVTVPVSNPTISVTPSTLASGTPGTPYSQSLTTAGGHAPYTFSTTLASGALPGGLSLTGNGTISGTPTVSGTYTFTVSGADSSTGTGPFVFTSSTISLTVSAPAIAVAPPTLPAMVAGSLYPPQTFIASGGTAPYTFSISGGTLPSGMSFSGDTLSGTPSSAGAYSFTVQATDRNGFPGTRTYSGTVAAPPAPVVSDVSSVAVPYETAKTIDLTASITGMHSSIAIGTAPAHGTTSIAGDVVTYTPAAGYFGADSFTYTATGLGGTSASATVSLIVATPDAPVVSDVSSVAVPYEAAKTIDLTASITGIHSSIAIATAPAHGTTSITGDVVTYTPAAGYFGADSFTYTATGPGGMSASATVSLTVATPGAPVAGDVSSVAVPYEAAKTIDLTASITGLHDSIAIGTAPAHGTTSIAGDVVTYTPAAGYFGADSFTYTATGPGGISASATVSLTVATPGAPVAGDVSSVAVPYQTAQTIDLTASITGLHDSIAIGTAPAHGTTSIAGDVVTYTPAAGYSGADSFTYTATGPGGTSAPATITLTVAAAPVAVFIPAAGTLSDAMAAEHYSETFSVPGGSAYRIASGTLPPGLTLGGDGKLDGAVAVGSEKTYHFTVSATVGGATVSASYELTVKPQAVTAEDKVVTIPPGATPLPVDLTAGATGGPFTDAIVGTVSPPQAGTAEIVMGDVASIDSVWSHKFYLKFHPNPAYSGTVLVGYTLVGAGGSSTATVTFIASLDPGAVAKSFDRLTRDFVETRGSLLANGVETPGLRQRRAMAAGTSPGIVTVSPSDDALTLNFASSLAELRSWNAAGDAAGALAAGGADADLPFNFWIDGTATLHMHNDDDGDDHWGKFALLSVGGDYLVNDKLLVGLAFHADFMDDLTDTTTIEGKGILVGPYVSAEIVDGVFLDASIYYGHSWNDIDTSIFDGTFETQRLLAKASLEGEWALSEALTLRPKANAFYLRETAGQYTVSDGLGSSVTVAGFTTEQLRLSAGGTLEYTLDLGEGKTLKPFIGGQLGLSMTTDKSADVFTTLTTGFDLFGLGNLTLGGAVEADIESDSLRSISAKATLSAGF